MEQSSPNAEGGLQKPYLLHRRLQAITEAVRAVTRATDEVPMLRDVCRIIVEIGGYRLAWIGYAEEDHEKTVRPVAHYGFEDGYLDRINITWADTERGRGPTGEAVRSRKTVIAQNILQYKGFEPWRSLALQRGYAALTAVPFTFAGTRVGALSVYAAEPQAFDADEAKLMEELAEDLAFGISTLRERIEHKKMGEALAYRTMLLEAQSETTIDGILAVDREGRVIFTNRRFAEIWGMPEHILSAENHEKLLEYALTQAKGPEEFNRKVTYLYQHPNEKSRDEIEFVDGRWFDRYSSPLTNADGSILGENLVFQGYEREQMGPGEAAAHHGAVENPVASPPRGAGERAPLYRPGASR